MPWTWTWTGRHAATSLSRRAGHVNASAARPPARSRITSQPVAYPARRGTGGRCAVGRRPRRARATPRLAGAPIRLSLSVWAAKEKDHWSSRPDSRAARPSSRPVVEGAAAPSTRCNHHVASKLIGPRIGELLRHRRTGVVVQPLPALTVHLASFCIFSCLVLVKCVPPTVSGELSFCLVNAPS